DGSHRREESASQEGPGTDSERGRQGPPRGEDYCAAPGQEPDPHGRRVPRHLRSRPGGHDPHRPPYRGTAFRIRGRGLPRGLPNLLRDGHHRGRRLVRCLQVVLTNTYFGVSDHHNYIIARRPNRVGVTLSIAAQL